jgi:hypothetical protein
MIEPQWTATASQLPADGEVVLVKTARGTVEHRVTFRAAPEPRWETASLIAERDLYAYWRPAPERKHSSSEARAAPP